MAHLIDKGRVLEEIEKRIKETESMQPKFDQFWAGQISAYKGVLKTLNILEVKEVDLEKEYDNEFFKDPIFSKLVNRNAGISIAKHFFELGLKAQKEE